MSYVKLTLYIIGLIGSSGVWLPMLHIQREFFKQYSTYFSILLWVAVISLLVIKKYESNKAEKEMLRSSLTNTNEDN